MKKNNSGFSLVELIIVIAIMAVLVGVLAPQFIKYVEQSRESTDLQNIEELKVSVETAYADDDTITADTVITCDKSAKTIVISGGAATSVDAYGITATNAGTLKSAQWDANIVWTYSASTYRWTHTTTHAKYYNSDGSKYTAP